MGKVDATKLLQRAAVNYSTVVSGKIWHGKALRYSYEIEDSRLFQGTYTSPLSFVTSLTINLRLST